MSEAEAASDPVALVCRLVAEIEETLGAEDVRAAVEAVGGGRAKRRRLARGLADRPAVLLDGLSPAPRVVGELLIALKEAGAGEISAPRCAACTKTLRRLHRRGEDWLCSVCERRLEPCSSCGLVATVRTRDRSGRPRCQRCPEHDDRDLLALITAQVVALEPGADEAVIAEAIHKVTPRPSQLAKLAWAIEDNPALLSGDGHLSPVPSVLRLVETLSDAGIDGVRRPSCPRCGRSVRISKPLGGERVCRSCIAKSREESCYRCGARREPVTRDARGPVCANCFIRDPANLEICVNCGRLRSVETRSPHGPLCQACGPLPTLVCSICDTSAPCGISRLTGRPWCFACQRRSAPCGTCGETRPVRSGTLAEPRCEACTEPAFPDCEVCRDRLRAGQCPDCRLARRLAELLSSEDGEIAPALQPLHDALSATNPPGTALGWLRRVVVSSYLADVAADRRELSHEGLDALPRNGVLDHLRSVLVATGTLPARDEHMARLERSFDELVCSREDADQRQVVRRYALWHVLRRLRRRNAGKEATYEQFAGARRQVREAVALLDWLSSEQLTLGTCRQGDLDRFLVEAPRQFAAHFVRWAVGQRLCRLTYPAVRWRGPTSALDHEARWRTARRLLGDDTLNPRDRFAGLLVLLYAQSTASISRITNDQVELSSDDVRLRLGTVPVVLPEPLASLAAQLVKDNKGHATVGDDGCSRWLLPGGQPGRHVNAAHLGQRLMTLGIQPGPARSTAMFQLATDVPAAVLAQLLGMHIDLAVAWQHTASGDWMTYAAEASRRSRRAEQSGQLLSPDP
ncbi:MAG: hypothetical protein ACRD0Z_02260 [Acidimicrobiales bacterium]